jgi:hypothetical protein
MPQKYENTEASLGDADIEASLDDAGLVEVVQNKLRHNEFVEWAKNHPWVVAGLGSLSVLGFVSGATAAAHHR